MGLGTRRKQQLPPWVRDPLWRRARAVPAFDFKFEQGSLADSISGLTPTLTRASAVNAWNGTAFVSSASGSPAFQVDPRSGAVGVLTERESTNHIRNSSNTGAVVGTPGTLPTNWSLGNMGTLSSQVVQTGTIIGLPFIDLRIFGTSSTTSFNLFFETTTQIVAATGEDWVESMWLAMLPSTVTPPSSVEISLTERQAGGTAVVARNSGNVPMLSTLGRRYEYPITLNGGALVARVQPLLTFRITTATAYDFTIRIAGLQLERGVKPSSFIGTTNAAVTRAACSISFQSSALPASGTVVARYRPTATSTAGVVAALNDGTTSNRIEAGHSATGAATANVVADGISQSALTKTTTGYPGLRTAVLRYAANNVAFATDDTTAEVDNSATLPTVNRLDIGSLLGASGINGTIERVTIFPSVVDEATMALLQPRRVLNVFLVAGQSNANGSSGGATRTPEYHDFSITPDVFAWNGTTIKPFDHSTSGSSGDGRNWVSGSGWFTSFAAVALREIAYARENICACWVTNGGSSLNIGATGSGCWNANYAAIPEGTPKLAEALQNRYQSLVSHCASNNITLNVQGLIWHQGESDSSAEGQAAYQANFEALIASIRNYTGRATLPVFYGTTSTSGPAGVRTAHLAVDAADPHAWCRVNDDLGTSDGVHFDNPAKVTFGRWVAATYLANY